MVISVLPGGLVVEGVVIGGVVVVEVAVEGKEVEVLVVVDEGTEEEAGLREGFVASVEEVCEEVVPSGLVVGATVSVTLLGISRTGVLVELVFNAFVRLGEDVVLWEEKSVEGDEEGLLWEENREGVVLWLILGDTRGDPEAGTVTEGEVPVEVLGRNRLVLEAVIWEEGVAGVAGV